MPARSGAARALQHQLAERIPNATLEIVEGAGHLFLWDDAENLGRRIDKFLGRTSSRPSRSDRSSRSRRAARNSSNESKELRP